MVTRVFRALKVRGPMTPLELSAYLKVGRPGVISALEALATVSAVEQLQSGKFMALGELDLRWRPA